MGADQTPSPTRPPTLEDLKRVGAALNAANAKYLVIGGFAVNYYGLTRATEDLDLLIAQDPDNIERVKEALCVLPDQAAKDLVTLPFASLRTLIATKPGMRERDQLDRAYLLRLLAEQSLSADKPVDLNEPESPAQ